VLGIVGEALTNAGRHASASRVDVRAGLDGRALVVVVRDDGVGLHDLRPPGPTGGHGIAGMRERAEVLGGELRVESPPRGGTLVELRVPLAPPRPAERARVLLVDDHAAIREAIALAFAQDGDFIVTGQAASLAEARGLVDGIDVAIVDLELPDGDGADLIGELRARDPRVQTLVLSAHADRANVARAVHKGAAAVLGKTTHLHEVVSTVRRMRAGETLMPMEEMVELLRFAGRQRERELDERRLIESLSPRELEVLQLLAAGLDSASIARRLVISPRTERNHVAKILAKLDVHSQLQAVVFGLRHGVVDVPRIAEGS
jgi:DNA-binding NarL/FixJ family response regulator